MVESLDTDEFLELTQCEMELSEILEKLNEEDCKILTRYHELLHKTILEKDKEIETLERDLSDLEMENSNLEDDINELECELDDARSNKTNKMEEALRDIVKDRYFYVTPEYNTLEKLQDRIEYILKYMGD